MNDEKLCRNCKHMIPDRSWWWFCLFLPIAPFIARACYKNQYKFAKCGLTGKSSDYLVSGYKDSDCLSYCGTERDLDFPKTCGKAAQFFEPR